MKKMKKVLLILLIIGLVLIVGCVKEETAQGSGPSEEAQAIELADKSAFGKFSGWYEDAIKGEKNCDFETFVSILEKQGMIMDKEKRDSIKPYFDSAKQCWPSLEKKVEKIGEDKYRVIYSVESTSNCREMVEEMISSSQLKSIHNQAVVVDLKTKEIEMPEVRGQIPSVNSWEGAYELLETQMKQSEAIYGEDFETIIDCSMVGSFAMFQSMSPRDLIPKEAPSAETPKEPAQTKTISDCEKLTDSTTKDLCYLDIIRKTRDISQCEQATDIGFKNLCYLEIARQTKDSSLCEKITDTGRKEGCYHQIAIKTKDISLCEKIESSLKYNCYRDVT